MAKALFHSTREDVPSERREQPSSAHLPLSFLSLLPAHDRQRFQASHQNKCIERVQQWKPLAALHLNDKSLVGGRRSSN